MKKYKLKNGLTILHEQKKSKSVAISVLVKVGSNHENDKNRGISHFLEHMLFEGTRKRKDSREITNEIEKIGGDINAYTTTDRTVYYVKILKKHFDKGLNVLSDMIQNSVFREDKVEKERKVILKEIDMVNDQPRFLQWILFQKALFRKNNARHATYGTKETVKAITREEIITYYRNHYLASNTIVTIVGDVSSVRKKIEGHFSRVLDLAPPKYEEELEAKNTKKSVKIKKKLNNSYMVLGYKTVPRLNRESYVLDLIHGILGRGQSGWLFEEIRNKHGLAYEVGSNHEASKDYGFFAVYTNTDKKNIRKIQKIIMELFQRLKKISDEELKDAKNYIEGQFYMDNEDNFRNADKLGYWEMIKEAKLAENYVKAIRKLTKKDITNAVNKFLNKNYTLAVIEQS